MPTFSAFIRTNWPSEYEGYEIPENTDREVIQVKVREALNELYPNQWEYVGEQYIHKKSRVGQPILAGIHIHRTDIEALEYEIHRLEQRLAELPAEIAARRAKLAALMAEAGVDE